MAGALVAALVFAGAAARTPADWVAIAAMIVGIKAAFFWAGLYELGFRPTRKRFWARIVFSVVTAATASWLLLDVVVGERVTFFAFLVLFLPALLLSRCVFEVVTSMPRFRRRLLFLGVGKTAQRAAREILDERNRDNEIVGFLAETEDQTGWRIGGRPVLGIYSDVDDIVRRERIDQVVVAVRDRRKQLPLEELLRVRIRGVEVIEEAKVHEEIAGKIPVQDLRPSWLIFGAGFSNSWARGHSKRLFDVAAACLGLLLSAPLSLLVALAIKLESPGPVLFRQKRVGQGGEEFTIYKFRSMRVDAEKDGKPVWATAQDPRVTRIGRFARKTRLDEIPQMWNVLQGTMSFVGPRPERLFFVEQLRERIPFYDQRHAVKPGITGWAQVRYGYGADESDAVEKLRHDMFYIKHHSILFDLRILLETVRVVFQKNMGR
jgi:sugar transferase (PEP-CTERM system associated)